MDPFETIRVVGGEETDCSLPFPVEKPRLLIIGGGTPTVKLKLVIFT